MIGHQAVDRRVLVLVGECVREDLVGRVAAHHDGLVDRIGFTHS